MSVVTQFDVYVGPPGAKVDRNPDLTFEEALAHIVERVTEEVVNFRKGGFEADPTSIQIGRSARLGDGWVSVIFKAERS